MLTLTLALVLQLSPADAPVVAEVEPLPPPPPVVQLAPRPSLRELSYQLEQLNRKKPSFGAPAVLNSLGASAVVSGLLFLIIGVANGGLADARTGAGMTVMGLLSEFVGLPMTGLGVTLAIYRRADRAAWQEDVDDLRLQVREAVRNEPLPPVPRQPGLSVGF